MVDEYGAADAAVHLGTLQTHLAVPERSTLPTFGGNRVVHHGR